MIGVALTDEDRTRISEAIQAAERKTSGEIYVVVAHTADEFRFVPVLWAALAALLLPWPLHLLTSLPTTTVLLLQSIMFVLTALVLGRPALRHTMVPAVVAAEASRRSARALFFAHGVHLTEARTGLLIYVAVLNRRVEIVADAGIHAKVDEATWDGLADEVTLAARENRLGDGLVTAVQRAGLLLATHFPPEARSRNELSDRVVVLERFTLD